MTGSLPLVTPEQVWRDLVEDRVHIVDVRAPVEFKAGRIPSSVNHPILNDEERALIGTTYKNDGSEKAIALGHQLVQGEVKERRVRAWVMEISETKKTPVVTCFRGGLRSQIAQMWLAEAGLPVPRIAGGYKKMRQLLTHQLTSLCENKKILVVTGKTGAGKTQFVNEVRSLPTLDLEFLAKHRGSAFGAYAEPQPTQVDFENTLALEFARATRPSSALLVEDESRLIGRCVQPEPFFQLLRTSPVIYLDEPLELRVENILREYVAARADDPDLFPRLQRDLGKIKNKLGGLRHGEVSEDLRRAEADFLGQGDLSASRVWIEKLMRWYYDPMYEASLLKRNPRILARGERTRLLEWLERGL